MNARQFLSQTFPFKVLPAAELDRLSGRARSHTYAKGETVYSEGDVADSIWVLAQGRVQIFKYSSEGRPLAIESIARGERAPVPLHRHRSRQFRRDSDCRSRIFRRL